MNNESKLRECQNCGCLESSHPIIPTKVGGKYCNHFIQSTTPIEDGKSSATSTKTETSSMDNNNMDGIEWERVTVDKSLLERYDKLKSQADELARALEFCLGKEVFPQGVCKEDKETESYTVAVKALSNYRKGE